MVLITQPSLKILIMKKVTKINLGCGPIGLDDWINIDFGLLAFLHYYKLIPLFKKIISITGMHKIKALDGFCGHLERKWANNLMYHDCTKNLPFGDNEVDYIFTSHFVEHIKYYRVLDLLREMYRVLKKGGVTRISVPDISIITKKYLNKDKNFFEKNSDAGWNKEYSLDGSILLGDAFCSFFYSYYAKNYQGKFFERLLNIFVRPHEWLYDFESLKDLFLRAGFNDVIKRSYREGKVPDIDKLDAHSDESLYIEAKK